MKLIERLKLISELTRLASEVKGASETEKLSKTRRIITIVRMLGGMIEGPISIKRTKVTAEDGDKVTSVEDFCKRVEKEFKELRDPRNNTRKLLFAYLEENFPWGFYGTLRLKDSYTNMDHRYAAGWEMIDGEWLRFVQAHDEMEGALSQLDPDGALVLIDFWRMASNGSLNEQRRIPRDTRYPIEILEKVRRKDREILQSIIDGKHPDMRSTSLYDVFAAVDEREGGSPDFPEYLELQGKALDAWQAVVMDMTADIVA